VDIFYSRFCYKSLYNGCKSDQTKCVRGRL
jgi:hypothetical protein